MEFLVELLSRNRSIADPIHSFAQGSGEGVRSVVRSSRHSVRRFVQSRQGFRGERSARAGLRVGYIEGNGEPDAKRSRCPVTDEPIQGVAEIARRSIAS